MGNKKIVVAGHLCVDVTPEFLLKNPVKDVKEVFQVGRSPFARVQEQKRDGKERVKADPAKYAGQNQQAYAKHQNVHRVAVQLSPKRCFRIARHAKQAGKHGSHASPKAVVDAHEAGEKINACHRRRKQGG